LLLVDTIKRKIMTIITNPLNPTVTEISTGSELERPQGLGTVDVMPIAPSYANPHTPTPYYNPTTPAACGWYQAPDTGGGCQFSAVSVLQSVFGLPSKIVEPALLGLPGMLVPVVGLAVNVGAWWLVYKVVSKRVLGWKD